ncbi:MAG: phosphoglycerate kinase [Candidatus Doudnabacteria bacterium RIFCSPLOWO2_01_FULL_44_21]|uniref:Phosphoglycerate kinase n=1 Tax=Candidatus Doudnabacteria bacterium RIFCSPLOWO2_01_FULL_44_21 TaxID=1817841 RepID=A0A1F5PX12_9BACT|nr:MAG: phosphoglycerate kinase [Candidatus Doudnabacteria bacterium RIFCSPHIGHO2_02_FULL_43_13b]OGE94459.1 MAG: phosphoglycerate kinase [Candidatus Doudnabacteria bacterium RIFCSPLOWO2_01_FULL_44_21]
MIKSITSVKVSGRRVILRVGFDVPLTKNIHTEEWEVADDTRIRDILPTLRYLIDQGSRIVIMSHLGRPQGWEAEKSLWPAALKLGELINYKTVKIENRLPDYAVPHINFLTQDITKQDYSEFSQKLLPGHILFLENLRFYPQEQKNDEQFAKVLASYGDVYVDEAFSVAHRQEVSLVALARLLPSYAGISLMRELASFRKLLQDPKHPMIVLMGGVKISDKVETINNLMRFADKILIGGALANNFLKVLGYEIGKSTFSNGTVAKQLLRNYKGKLVLPIDLVVAKSTTDRPRLCKIDKVLPHEIILDIGPETIRKFAALIKQAKTLVWNGPFGYIENPKFAFGTKSLAHIFGARSKGFAYGVVGGGETVEIINQVQVASFIDHVSTGGGAMLELLAGKQLPAIKALENSK